MTPGAAASVLLDRNPFCSDCTTGPGGPPLPPGDDGEVRRTTRPLVLVATSLGGDPADSYATIRNTETGAQGAFWLGQAVPGAGVIDKVAGTFVWLRVDGTLERVDLLTIAEAPPPPPGKPEAARETHAYADRVREVGDGAFEVDRALVRDLVGSGGRAKVPGVRLAPATGADGKLKGIRVSQARKDSLAGVLGLKSGDVIEALDGKAIDSPDVLLEAYGNLETAANVRVRVARGGKPVELDYRLR